MRAVNASTPDLMDDAADLIRCLSDESWMKMTVWYLLSMLEGKSVFYCVCACVCMIKTVQNLPIQYARILWTHTHTAIHSESAVLPSGWGEEKAGSLLTWGRSYQRVMRPNGNAFKAAQIMRLDRGRRWRGVEEGAVWIHIHPIQDSFAKTQLTFIIKRFAESAEHDLIKADQTSLSLSFISFLYNMMNPLRRVGTIMLIQFLKKLRGQGLQSSFRTTMRQIRQH